MQNENTIPCIWVTTTYILNSFEDESLIPIFQFEDQILTIKKFEAWTIITQT